MASGYPPATILETSVGQSAPVIRPGLNSLEKQASVKAGDLHRADFSLGKRPQGEHFHSAGQGLGYLGQQHRVSRAGQQETAGRAVFVHTRAF
jgi:hypothetical protein